LIKIKTKNNFFSKNKSTMAKYTDIPNVEEGIGPVSEIGTSKKEFKVIKFTCIGLCLIGAYMLGVSMSVGSDAKGALMVSNAGASCARVSSIADEGYPDQSQKFGPECTEIGDDFAQCIPPRVAPIIISFANTLSAVSPFPQMFTTKSCSSQGFDSFNRNVDIKDVIGNPGNFVIPTTLVRVYRKPGWQNENTVNIRNVNSRLWLDGRGPNFRQVWLKQTTDRFTIWKFERIQGIQYAIKSVSSGNYLDGRNSSFENQEGAVLVTDNTPSTEGEGRFLLWTIEKFGNYYALKSVSSGLYLDGRAPGFPVDSLKLTSRTPTASDRPLLWEIEAQS